MATILITGCNRGIGLQLCTQLSARGDQIIGVCRQRNAELDALDIEVIEHVDVSVQEDIDRLSAVLRGRSIDVIISNAGILMSDTFDTIDFDQMIEQFRVNALGPLRVVKALHSNLGAGSKIAIVSSRVGSIADNSSGNNYGYRISKAAANMLGMNLKHEFASRGIAVALLHPGYVATDMTHGTGVEPSKAASGLIARIDGLGMENSGGFWHAEGHLLPW